VDDTHDGTIQLVNFVWNNKELIFSDKNPKERMKNYYKDLSWENTSIGIVKHPKVISDIGGHHGEFSTSCTSIFSNSKIYCYEPIISNFKKITSWVDGIKNTSAVTRSTFNINYVGNEFEVFLDSFAEPINETLNNYGKLDINFIQYMISNFYLFLITSKTDGLWGEKLKDIVINVSPINIDNFHLFNFGLWSEDTEMDIGISDTFKDEEETSGLFSVLHSKGFKSEKVKMKDIRTLSERPELVKIDAEGSEWEIFNNCGSYFDETKIMLVEIVKDGHPNFNNHNKIPPLLESWGFIELETADGSDNKIYGRI
jgi:hypothetical protein